MPKIRITCGKEEQKISITSFEKIGRDETSTIAILDPLVSRSHAIIRQGKDGRYILEDTGSRHGTFMNGEKIRSVVLEDGDVFVIGSTDICFEADGKKTEGESAGKGKDSDSIFVMRRRIMDAEPAFPSENAYSDEKTLRRDFERLRVAYEISRSIGALTDLEAILEAILDAAFHLLDADRGAILLVNEHGKLIPRASRRSDGSRERVQISTSIIREVLEKKSGVVCADAGSDARFGKAASVRAQALRSTMSVPLFYREEILGILHLDSQTATGIFSEKDLELFASIANQAAIAIKSAYLARQAQEEAKQRQQFQRFLPPSLVDQIMKGELELGTKGTLQEVTVLFLDIRGFTKLSESEKPEAIVEMLNGFFEAMLGVLFRHGGTFDKYIGDEIMALFGVPVAMPDAEDRAVSCALGMQQALSVFNKSREAEGKTIIEAGIGIHSGKAVCGAIGTAWSMQYTAIGDTVNTASRLCSAAKPGQLLISGETLKRMSERFTVEKIEPVPLKGKSRPVEAALVHGTDLGNVPDDDYSEMTMF